PSAQELRRAFDNLFGPESRLPECARRGYTFRPPPHNRAEAWKSALPQGEHGRLGEARAAFEKLVAESADDCTACFNPGLVAAWQGDHARGIEALTRSVELESDTAHTTEAAALMEVLRCGEGMESQSDYTEHRSYYQIRETQPVVQLLQDW